MRYFWKGKFFSEAVHFFFPSVCLHCSTKVESPSLLFCVSCAPFFEMLSPQGRCKYCFHEDNSPLCEECASRKVFIPTAAALSLYGPVHTFAAAIAGRRHAFLLKTAAAMLFAQWHRLQWPLPEYIIPFCLDTAFYKKTISSSIAGELKKYWKIPACNPLLRTGNTKIPFLLKKKNKMEGKTLLLINDLFMPEMHLAATALLSGFPKKIYILTLCSAK